MEHDPVETIRAFGRFLDDVSRAYPCNEARISQLDAETQDILHEMELGEHSYHELARLSRELTRVRRERRECKEENEALKPLVDYLAKEPIRQRLGQVQGYIDAARKRQAVRQYTPRVRGMGAIVEKKEG